MVGGTCCSGAAAVLQAPAAAPPEPSAAPAVPLAAPAAVLAAAGCGGMGGTRCSAGDAIAAGGARGSPTLLVAAEDPAQHASLCILLDHRGVDEGVMMGWSMREGGKKQRDVHQASFYCTVATTTYVDRLR